MRAAVVGHLEWVQFVRVDELPAPGDISAASDWWEEPAGGGPAAAVQLEKLTGDTIFLTALGDDELGRRSLAVLADKGLRVEAVLRDRPTRRAVTFVDSSGERTITTIGERLNPHAGDPLPWDALDGIDGCYFTAGDEGALHEARKARVLVATARVLSLVSRAGVGLDALVGSSVDPSEAYTPGDLRPDPALVVRTGGAGGGTFGTAHGRQGSYKSRPPRGAIVDRYGAGDAFAAGLTYGLAGGFDVDESLELASRCGAAVLTGRGPYTTQLSAADLRKN